MPFLDNFNESSECICAFLTVAAGACFVKSVFEMPRQKRFFEVWEYTSIVYVSTPFFFKDWDDRQSGLV